MEEKKNKSLIIIIVILVILLSCSVGYIVYDNFIKEDEVTENNDNQNNGGNNEEENDELSELGLELFEKILSLRDGYNELLFVPLNGTLTYDNINKGVVIEYFLEESDKHYNESYNRDECLEQIIDDGEIPENNEYLDTCYNYYVDKNTFDNLYYEMFGTDKVINYSNIYLTCGIIEERNNGVYTYDISGCGGASGGIPYIRYSYSKLNGDNLEIYFDYIFIQGATEIENNTNELFENNNIYEYRATFKKDANDNYYWYSTELI